VGAQQAIHRRDRAQVGAVLVQQTRPTCAGARSQNRSEFSVDTIAARSALLSARGDVRGRRGRLGGGLRRR
jgi:hypothetical protein